MKSDGATLFRRAVGVNSPVWRVVGQFAKSAARLLAAAGLLFLKLTHYRLAK